MSQKIKLIKEIIQEQYGDGTQIEKGKAFVKKYLKQEWINKYLQKTGNLS